jgi:hypothetical protein
MVLRTLPLISIALALPTALFAQQAPTWSDGHVTLMAGVSVFDRSGTGTTGIYSLRADLPIYPAVLVEGGLSYARRGEESGIGDVFIPGIQAHLQATSGQFSPYIGLGAGVTVETAEGGDEDDISFSPSFSAGIRSALSEGAGIRFEGRLNGVGADFGGLYSELTGGFSISW